MDIVLPNWFPLLTYHSHTSLPNIPPNPPFHYIPIFHGKNHKKIKKKKKDKTKTCPHQLSSLCLQLNKHGLFRKSIHSKKVIQLNTYLQIPSSLIAFLGLCIYLQDPCFFFLSHNLRLIFFFLRFDAIKMRLLQQATFSRLENLLVFCFVHFFENLKPLWIFI